MIINVARVSVEGSSFEGELPPSILELENDKFVKAKGPVRYDLNAQVVSSELIVTGAIEAELEVECSRCTGFFSTTIRVSSFLRAYEVPEGTELVDLTADIREDILLSIPSFFLCAPTCKGLCVRCGKNLNEGPCDCAEVDQKTGAWTKLDDLQLPENENQGGKESN